MSELKRLDFAKGEQIYSYYFDDVRALINHLVDAADAGRGNLDLMDIFSVVNRLAKSPSPAVETAGIEEV